VGTMASGVWTGVKKRYKPEGCIVRVQGGGGGKRATATGLLPPQEKVTTKARKKERGKRAQESSIGGRRWKRNRWH